MAKCLTCESRKGKRKCQANGAWICSKCCGEIRDAATCTGCSFFSGSAEKKNYRKVPFYGTEQMSTSIELQSVGQVVESIFCTFDVETQGNFTDRTALQLLEAFFDVHHFEGAGHSLTDPALREHYEKMSSIIEEELRDVPWEQIVKVMASVYRSIQRRTNGGREYLSFVQRFVGPLMDSGT
ncbi:hypothetical protein [Desulfogranum japonicum]|uniref:hypothetical protein n=1 Tax=Desulfogranum japonicum TaxID=231447 RepID=UPI00048DC7F9|nr:hypothetical protein [Desulfogranum japonicum]